MSTCQAVGAVLPPTVYEVLFSQCPQIQEIKVPSTLNQLHIHCIRYNVNTNVFCTYRALYRNMYIVWLTRTRICDNGQIHPIIRDDECKGFDTLNMIMGLQKRSGQPIEQLNAFHLESFTLTHAGIYQETESDYICKCLPQHSKQNASDYS
jgi:hypothetical protein